MKSLEKIFISPSLAVIVHYLYYRDLATHFIFVKKILYIAHSSSWPRVCFVRKKVSETPVYFVVCELLWLLFDVKKGCKAALKVNRFAHSIHQWLPPKNNAFSIRRTRFQIEHHLLL